MTVLELLVETKRQTTKSSKHKHELMDCQFLEIHTPSGLDLSQNTEYALEAALWGIEVSAFVYLLLLENDVLQVGLNYKILFFFRVCRT